ncbi:ankyrin repeat domain-containing protein 45 [Pseudoliparis swirei]|uniref:ankyrin repeat domain-containing protein 45 n=1 Tax=Pseudoliparis swirei TaxID=2059687 RepID=UPI0024BED515|nr:ankyrin repeat domain-containing protein 45 [Pseudoliparis swirei]
MTSTQREVFTRVLSGDLEGLTELLDRDAVAGGSPQTDPCGVTDEMGRNALMTACMLGRSAIARVLVDHGASVNEQTVRGYSSLHLAACWGHLDTVRVLLELGADPLSQTFTGQRPVDLAMKYCKTDCVDCLLLAEAKQDLASYVDLVRDLVSDPEKSLTKEEKIICTNACSSKTNWIETVGGPAASDFTAQRRHMEDAVRPVLDRLSARGLLPEQQPPAPLMNGPQ